MTGVREVGHEEELEDAQLLVRRPGLQHPTKTGGAG
jgi:hypothetical protein